MTADGKNVKLLQLRRIEQNILALKFDKDLKLGDQRDIKAKHFAFHGLFNTCASLEMSCHGEDFHVYNLLHNLQHPTG